MSPEAPAKVLLVEDEPVLAEGIAHNLRAEGYTVVTAVDGLAALASWRQGDVDAMILDIMLPKLDGWQVCQQVRAEGGRLPILFLSAKNSHDDRIRGLRDGGDDYLGKPFVLSELLARVEAMLRRQRWLCAPAAGLAATGPHQVELGGHRIDFRSQLWWPPGATTAAAAEVLPHKELAILKLLCERCPSVVGREEILAVVWGDDVYPSSRTIDNFVVRLRRRIEPDPQLPRYLHTVRGVGYRLTVAAPGGHDNLGEAAKA